MIIKEKIRLYLQYICKMMKIEFIKVQKTKPHLLQLSKDAVSSWCRRRGSNPHVPKNSGF